MLSASTVVAKVIYWECLSTDLMTTGRSPVQHQGPPGPKKTRNTDNNYCIFDQNRYSHQQARFDKWFNRQYLHNYNYQPFPTGSIPGQDLSTALIELANIQSRLLEIMAAYQRSQQEALSEITKASKDKANDAMLASIKTYDGRNRRVLED